MDRGSLMAKVSQGVLPLAVTLGFAATPSSNLVARVAGATAGGLVGVRARRYIEERFLADVEQASTMEEDFGARDDEDFDDGLGGGGSSAAVNKFMKKLVTSGLPLESLTSERLQKACRKASIPANDLGEIFTRTFAELVYQATTEDSMDLTELSYVIDFALAMELSEAEVGDGFTLAALKLADDISRDERGFFVMAPPVNVLHAASKIFFLADKLIESRWNSFYGKRISTSLYYFTPDSFNEVITEASQQLFMRCVESVLARPDDFQKSEVDSLREYLTTDARVSELRPSNMQNIVSEALQTQVEQALANNGGKPMDASVGNYDSLVKSQEVLGWSSLEFSKTVEIQTMPLFKEAAKQLVENLHAQPEHASELAASLNERIEALKVDVCKARIVLTNLISDKNQEFMATINRVYNVSDGNLEPTFKIMTAYAAYHDALEVMVEKVMDGITIPTPGLPFADMVRVSMYEMNLKSNKIGSGKMDMFELNEAQRDIVKRNMAMPKLISWVKQCIDERNLSEEAAAAYSKMLSQHKITTSDWAATAADFYYQEAARVSNVRAVPSADDMQYLKDLSTFLKCPQETMCKVNLELFGDKYVKALSEAMMPSGIITEEYEDGLTRLSSRLGLSDKDRDALLAVAVRERLVPTIKNMVDQMKSDVAGSGREQSRPEYQEKMKRKMQDPISSMDNVLGYMEDMGAQKAGGGPNVFMREALNLVDFFSENYFSQKTGKADSKDKFVELDQLALPVSAFGAVPNDDLVDIMKHYMLTRLAETDEGLRARYESEEKFFAAILGIDRKSLNRLKEAVTYNAFKNILTNIFSSRDALQPAEFSQLALMTERLNFDVNQLGDGGKASREELFEELLKKASRSVLLKLGRNVFKRDKPLYAEDAERIRNQIESVGLSMTGDMGFNDRLRSYLFTLEVQELVDRGAPAEDLIDIQDAYSIPIERAEAIIESACKRYISQLLNLALRAAKKYDEPGAVLYVKRINQYVMFVDEDGSVDADGNIFRKTDKDRLVGFYENHCKDAGDVDESDLKEQCRRLGSLINLTEDFEPPIDGIDGLLADGRLKLDQEKHDDSKGRRWAWG